MTMIGSHGLMVAIVIMAQRHGFYGRLVAPILLMDDVSGFAIIAGSSTRRDVGLYRRGCVHPRPFPPSLGRETRPLAVATLDDGGSSNAQMFENELPPSRPDQASMYNNGTVALSTYSSYRSPVDNVVMTNTASYAAVEAIDHEASYAQEQQHQQQPIHQDIQRERPLGAYLLLASAVVALASLAPLLNLQHDVVSPILKITWRMAGTSLLVLPLALRDLHKDAESGKSASFTTADVFKLVMAAASYCVWNLGFVVSLDYTSVGDAAMFSNCQALVLLVAKVAMQGGIKLTEGVGTMTALTGALLCSQDSAAHAAVLSSVTGGGELGLSSTDGDLLAGTSSLGAAGYLTFAPAVREKMGPWAFTFFIMSLGTVMLLFVEWFVLKEPISFDMDPNSGVLGFLNPDRLPLELAIVFFANILGVLGYLRSLDTFSSLTVSTVCLLEPIVAGFLGVGLGTGSLPGNLGWLGNALVAGGIFTVVRNEVDEPDKEVEGP